MSFNFSDLVIGDNDNDKFDYMQFLADPIYDWLNSHEEILQVCDDIKEEKKKVTIIQQAQPQNTAYYKKIIISTRSIP
jgi:hypothetical protein